jgi:signal transduction histidine kinase
VLLDIDLRLRPNVEAPAEARRSLEALRPSLDDLLVDDAVLLVSEIVSNSVRHASLDASDTIEVRVRGSRSMLHVDVVDPGPGFDPMHLRPSRENGGWGLWMLDRLATRWGVERNHVTKVWFELGSAVSRTRTPGT